MTTALFTGKMKLSELLLANYQLLKLLSRFNIPLGFGDKSVEDICTTHKITPDFFLMICNIYTFDDYLPKKKNLQNIQVGDILFYLSASHEYYLSEQLPSIESTLKSISESCNSSNVLILNRFFSEYKEEVVSHFRYEEEVVFPYVKGLLKGVKAESYRIRQFKENHSNIEDKLGDLINILIKYLPAEIDQKKRIEVLFNLFNFTADLAKHSLIEEKILVPYVASIENDRNKQ